MNSKTVGYIMIILLGLALGLNHAIEVQHNMYLKESKCIKNLVNSGIQRKDIITDNSGNCWIKDNNLP